MAATKRRLSADGVARIRAVFACPVARCRKRTRGPRYSFFCVGHTYLCGSREGRKWIAGAKARRAAKEAARWNLTGPRPGAKARRARAK